VFTLSRFRAGALALAGLLALPHLAPAQTPAGGAAADLDAFMEKTLARREQNRQTLERYVLNDVERVQVLGPGRTPLFRQHREFTWYVRDGLHVRSPVRFGGVAVGDDERARYEADWIRREHERLERRRKKEAGEPDAKPEPEEAPPLGPPGTTPIPTPRFVSEAYFMDFAFEPGNYYFAGRERIEGRGVYRIEYYPTRMFGEREDGRERRPPRDERARREAEDIRRRLNRTALITLWVDPAEHQIVKYVFDNVWMDFLPGAWLVRVDEIGASMTMGQPFEGVWLPRELQVHGGVTLANGSYRADYSRTFSDYRLAEVSTRITIPKAPEEEVSPPAAPAPDDLARPEEPGSGPYVPDGVQARETIEEIRVHGNVAIPDADVIRLARIEPGQPLGDGDLAAIGHRLERSGLFQSVEVRKRSRSLSESAAVALLLIVHEKAGITSVEDQPGGAGGAWRRVREAAMFLPIVNYTDGYGFTYGGRVSTVDLLGAGERLSLPLTWGGTRRAALEVERTFDRGPLTLIQSSFGVAQRENPHFELDDRRVEWNVRAERHAMRIVRTGVHASTGSVDFGGLDDRLRTVGADIALDTRDDPAFPRHAVYLGAGWTGLYSRTDGGRIDRYSGDARGYLGLVGQAVLAARVQYTAAGDPLPEYERLLLGGASTLRGFRAGAFSGDRMLVTSTELRVPITSILRTSRLGLIAFFDAGRIHDDGMRVEDAAWHRAAGGGVFLIAPMLRVNLDVARALREGGTRAHLAVGFGF